MELNGSVSVGVDSEQVPEDVLEFPSGVFVKDFNDESFKIVFSQVSLGSSIIPVEVSSKLTPDSINELPFLVGDVAGLASIVGVGQGLNLILNLNVET